MQENSMQEHRIMTAHEDGYFVLSFDFAENLLVPLLNPQPGSFYFNSRRKIEIFGVTDESKGIQTNYIFDECHKINKGPNQIISMMHHHISTKIPEGAKMILYCDNCPGQNKNQTVIAYLCYLVHDLKRHPFISLNFMVSGHTKFAPDRHFGTLKKKIKNQGCSSILDLVGNQGLVKQSAKDNEYIVYKDPITFNQNFGWYGWDEFLNRKYGACTGIRNWHIINISEDKSNISVSNGIGQPFEDYNNNIHADIQLNTIPGTLNPAGLSQERIRQLKHFEPYIKDEHKPFILNNF